MKKFGVLNEGRTVIVPLALFHTPSILQDIMDYYVFQSRMDTELIAKVLISFRRYVGWI